MNVCLLMAKNDVSFIVPYCLFSVVCADIVIVQGSKHVCQLSKLRRFPYLIFKFVYWLFLFKRIPVSKPLNISSGYNGIDVIVCAPS